MKNLRRSFDLFCMKNRNKGIPNLMLYICVGNAIVYLMTQISGNTTLYSLLFFHREAILHGQVWRLITFPLTMYNSNLLLMLISLFCYYSLGTVIERMWGTLRFNLFYLSGVILIDLYSMLFNCHADVYQLNMSLFLSYATLFPNASFLLFFIIPVKAWIFALFDFGIILLDVLGSRFPANMLPLVALANYFLFFGKDVMNIFPLSWRIWFRKITGGKAPVRPQQPKVIQFKAAPQQQKKPDYNHRCTVCGRTDVSNPELEFRYCSKCSGFHCYCEEHISNHTHIQ